MAEGGPVAQDRLKSFIERIERLEEEKAALMADIKEVYSEAKGTGFDVKTMRKVISLRKTAADAARIRFDVKRTARELFANLVGVFKE